MTPILSNAALVVGALIVSAAIYASLSGPDWLNRGLGVVMAIVAAAIAAMFWVTGAVSW